MKTKDENSLKSVHAQISCVEISQLQPIRKKLTSVGNDRAMVDCLTPNILDINPVLITLT